MKRAADGPGDRGGVKIARASKYGPCAFKVLCPEGLVSKIMGDRAGALHELEERTGTHLQFSPRGEYWPPTRLRILTVFAKEPGPLAEALAAILDHIADRAAVPDERDRPDDFVDGRGRLLFRCALSKSSMGAVIGTRGERVKRLRESSGAHVDIDREVVDGQQMATVAGQPDQVLQALEELSGLVQNDAQEAWFAAWASQIGVSATPSSGGAGDRRGHDRGERGDRGEPGDRGTWRRSHDTPEHRGCTIFVGRLAQATTTESLRRYFRRFGEVLDADVRIDRDTGNSKGFGFVTFAEPSSVDACMAGRNEHSLDDRRVDVKRYGESGHDDDRRRDRGRPEDSRSWPSRGAQGGGARHEHEGMSWFCGVADSLKPEYAQLDYCISCSLPSVKCGALIGRKGENIIEVQRITNTDVTISKKDPQDPPDAHRTVTITGPLFSIYAAHMLLMKHYNDDEAQFQVSLRESFNGGGGAGAGPARIEAIQRQLAALSEQLHSARGMGSGAGSGAQRGPPRRRSPGPGGGYR